MENKEYTPGQNRPGRRGGMHQIDERAAQRDLRKVSEIYALTLKNFAMKEY